MFRSDKSADTRVSSDSSCATSPRIRGSASLQLRTTMTRLSCLLAALAALALDTRADSLRLVVQHDYLPQIPVLVRVEVLKPDGSKNRDLWDAQATLTVDQPGVTLSTNSVTLRNGVGTALVTFAGGDDFNLTATVGTSQATRL